MPYITTNEADHIVGVFATQQFEGQEFAEQAELYVSPPTPLEQIRALEAPNDDDRKKLTRQFMLAIMLKEAMALAPQLTKEQVHDALMLQVNASGKGYAKLYLEEQAIVPLREQIP